MSFTNFSILVFDLQGNVLFHALFSKKYFPNVSADNQSNLSPLMVCVLFDPFLSILLLTFIVSKCLWVGDSLKRPFQAYVSQKNLKLITCFGFTGLYC